MRIDAARPAGPFVAGLSAAGFKVEDAQGVTGVYPALLLTPVRADPWTPPALDALDIDALAPILDPVPEFILLGTGRDLSHPPRALVRALDARGIGIEAMDSRAAARAWGVLRSEDRRIAAAFYPL
ncbi:hypothetical protein ASG29_07520 [Sphingomonas sp. Leaf412]|uniref:Mth938-like domain-containing protein n=1 Tax=Sphingomonas sp. Leaf412 TaxID=1736370 RepID=UPI0006F23A5E|nr:Mth938-like domain-containing protein [Sphingomonas sp. Leaf412]KQT31758.1 hypothetical protein ASG29_07520 [Sphingomonas sp. Leaf412]